MDAKNVILIVLALLGGALFFALQRHAKDNDSSFKQASSPAIDKPAARYAAPDFTLADLDNEEHSLSDLRGTVVVMTFWTTW